MAPGNQISAVFGIYAVSVEGPKSVSELRDALDAVMSADGGLPDSTVDYLDGVEVTDEDEVVTIGKVEFVKVSGRAAV